MAGHSKWNNIKRRKGAADEKRGKLFTKIGREIAVAVKSGGANPESNSKLRDAIAKAKSNNMPNDSIARSIQKASGADAANYERIVYEGYGPSGVAVMVEALTDNRNRTASDVRLYFDKFGGNLGQPGCVSFMFMNDENDEYVPIATVKLESEDDVKNMEKLLDHLEDNDDIQEVIHNWEWDEEEE